MATAEEFKGVACDAGALEWEDIEGVHRMRVASRRLRSALSDFDDLGARLYLHRDESEGDGGQDADARVRLAAIWLLNHFTKERGKHFRRALARRRVIAVLPCPQ